MRAAVTSKVACSRVRIWTYPIAPVIVARIAAGTVIGGISCHASRVVVVVTTTTAAANFLRTRDVVGYIWLHRLCHLVHGDGERRAAVPIS